MKSLFEAIKLTFGLKKHTIKDPRSVKIQERIKEVKAQVANIERYEYESF